MIGPMARIEEQPELKETLQGLEKTMAKQRQLLERLAAYAARREWRGLLAGITNPLRLEHSGRKVYSQNDEDGIIEEIFRRVGIVPARGIFIEFGAGQGLENNTHYLLRKGYTGVWLEASADLVDRALRSFRTYIERGVLQIERATATAEMIDDHLSPMTRGRDVALLAIDLDGNDYWVWKAIRSFTAAVVVIEYNARCPPPVAQVQEYRADHAWNGTDYFGASLSALEKLGAGKGYRLVGCNITGTNAFFVRQDLLGGQFEYALTAEHLYQPPRYDLTYDCFARVGHKPSPGVYVDV
jgi:hypothetical protein